MLPLIETNFNLYVLDPRSTDKSHLYKEISPNSILGSSGQTTVANLFYNMGRKTVGLVGLWNCVTFDEVAGINFKDKDGIQIVKDYMASASFGRGKNLNQREPIAVCRMVGGFAKLLYLDDEYIKEQLEEILALALEMHRRVKEQLKKMKAPERREQQIVAAS